MAKLAEVPPGSVHGRLTVLLQGHRYTIRYGKRSREVFCVCACTCGSVKVVRSRHLGDGTTSCGCRQGEQKPHQRKIALLTRRERASFSEGKQRAYNSWVSMWKRTTFTHQLAKAPSYVAKQPPQEWATFEAFFSDMGERPADKTLDRKDTRLGYSKENCRWATLKEQHLNCISNVFYTDGITVLDRTKLARKLALGATTLVRWEEKGKYPDGWRLVSYAEALTLLNG